MESSVRAVVDRRMFLFEGMALAAVTACGGEAQGLREGDGQVVDDASMDPFMTGGADGAAVLARSLEMA